MRKTGKSRVEEQARTQRYLPRKEFARETLWNILILSSLAYADEALEAEGREIFCAKHLIQWQKICIRGRRLTRRNADGEREDVIFAQGIHFAGAPSEVENDDDTGQDVTRGFLTTSCGQLSGSKKQISQSSGSADAKAVMVEIWTHLDHHMVIYTAL